MWCGYQKVGNYFYLTVFVDSSSMQWFYFRNDVTLGLWMVSFGSLLTFLWRHVLAIGNWRMYSLNVNNIRVNLKKVINRVVFDCILLIFYNSIQNNGDVSPKSYLVYFLTAVGLSPGGSTHLHTNNTLNDTKQTIHRTTQQNT